MPGKVKCPPGCTCRKHTGSPRIDWSDAEARRAYARECFARNHPKIPCPECGQPKVAAAEVCWVCHVKAKQAAAMSPEDRRRRNAASAKARRDADPERARQESREQYKRNGRAYNLKWKFGLTPERLAEMRAAQDSSCYLCGEPLVEGEIHIDHDRSCCRGSKSCGSCIRGLACLQCNTGIGHFGDDPNRRVRSIERQPMLFGPDVTTTRSSDAAERPGE